MPAESNPTTQQSDRQQQHAEAARSRCSSAGVPQHMCANALAALRDRVLAAEAYADRSGSQELEHALATAAVQPVSSDGLAPEQLQQLQNLMDEYTDQISWSSDDVGCLDPKCKAIYMRIPTEPGARCKQKPYRLSHKERDAFRRQLSVLLQQLVFKKASGPTKFLSSVLFVPEPRNPDHLADIRSFLGATGYYLIVLLAFACCCVSCCLFSCKRRQHGAILPYIYTYTSTFSIYGRIWEAIEL